MQIVDFEASFRRLFFSSKFFISWCILSAMSSRRETLTRSKFYKASIYALKYQQFIRLLIKLTVFREFLTLFDWIKFTQFSLLADFFFSFIVECLISSTCCIKSPPSIVLGITIDFLIFISRWISCLLNTERPIELNLLRSDALGAVNYSKFIKSLFYLMHFTVYSWSHHRCILDKWCIVFLLIFMPKAHSKFVLLGCS